MNILKTLLFISTITNCFIIQEKKIEPSDKIVGFWLSAEKDLKVEIFKKNNEFHGKVVWFACLPETPNMSDFKDTENPDPKLRNRPWLGMEVVENLKFNGKDAWEDGKIYDPNSGHTYSSVVRLKNMNTLIVRGYWGIEFFGKNLEFHRVVNIN
jgi:uncharacterized protein (DUF2147 family)